MQQAEQGGGKVLPPALWQGAPPACTTFVMQSSRAPKKGDFTEFERAMDEMAMRAVTDRPSFRRRSLFSKLQASPKARGKSVVADKELGELSVQNSSGSSVKAFDPSSPGSVTVRT